MTLLVLSGAAITLVFVRGSLFERVRKLWPGFLECPLCIGVWVGLLLWGLGTFEGTLYCAAPLGSTWVTWSADGLGIGALTGVSALVIHVVLDALESAANKLDR